MQGLCSVTASLFLLLMACPALPRPASKGGGGREGGGHMVGGRNGDQRGTTAGTIILRLLPQARREERGVSPLRASHGLGLLRGLSGGGSDESTEEDQGERGMREEWKAARDDGADGKGRGGGEDEDFDFAGKNDEIGIEWEERVRKNREEMKNMKGFKDWETFESAKKAINADDYEAYERIKKKDDEQQNMSPEEKLFWRMERYAKRWPPDWLERMQDKENPVVFLDISIRALDRKSTIEHEGRITIELFAHRVPRTAENFRCFCTGEVHDPKHGKPVGYKDVLFHRIIKGFCVQGGDFVKFDGTGCYSIFGGERFADEDLEQTHFAGAISMANAGVPDSNGCQFFVTTAKEAPFFDSKHVIVGQVVDGMETVGKIEEVPVVGRDYKPLRKVIVEECGQLK